MIKNNLKNYLKSIIRTFGFDVKRFDPVRHPLSRKRQLMKSYDIDLVLDVGANTGQFAQYLRNDIKYSKKIISFEPLSSAYRILKENAKGDDLWEVYNYALGDTNEVREINIAGNSASSSLLNMLPLHLKAAPQAHYMGKESVQIRTLDSIFKNTPLEGGGNNLFLKVDVQGYESKVLKGAENALQKIDTIQLEMSLVPLYESELLLPDMHKLMKEKGYDLVHIEPVFHDKKTGQLLQIDGIFHR